MLKVLMLVCFTSLFAVGCVDESPAISPDESELRSEDSSSELELAPQDCLAPCRARRDAELAQCNAIPNATLRQECRDDAWAAFSICIKPCL